MRLSTTSRGLLAVPTTRGTATRLSFADAPRWDGESWVKPPAAGIVISGEVFHRAGFPAEEEPNLDE